MTDIAPEKYTPVNPFSRHAAEWGLAALLTGGILIVAAPPTLLLSIELWQASHGGMSSQDALINAWLTRLGVLAMLVLAGAAVSFGIRAVRSAAKRGQPAGLAVAGLIVSWIAVAAWVITAIGLLKTTESLLRMYG